MDLPYPSQPDIDLQDNPIHRLDKRMRSTMWSMKDVGKNEQNLPQSARERLIRLIEKDRVWQLSRKLHEYGVNLQTEVGVKGSRWSLLHYCARWNATNCLEYLLRQKYQRCQDEYLSMLNSKSIEGYSPLMVAILYDSKDFLQTLLEYGGVDIFLINNNRLTAYQLAVSNKNQHAIKLLIEYQQVNKHASYIDKERLEQPFMFPDEEKPCCCTSMFKFFYEWMLPEPKDKELFENRDSQLTTPKALLVASERKSLTAKEQECDPDFLRTVKSICSDPQLLNNYRINWERAEELHHSDLYNSMNPFQIRQNNFALKHQLTVIQSLARQPWLVRRMAVRLPDKKGMYSFELFHRGFSEKVLIDDYLPCLRDKKEPLFLLNKKELWPMLLQKAWVKPYGCYLNTLNVQPKRMLQEMTGFPTETFRLANYRDQLFETLNVLIKSGYVVVLSTKVTAKLREDGQGSDSFAILSFYEKDGKRLYLVNCPFVLSKWKDKDRNEPLTLRVIKSHYKNDSQMSIWLDEEKLLQNFDTFTVCYVSENSIRSEIKAYSRDFLFFKFQIPEQEEAQSQPHMFKVYEYGGNGEFSELPMQSLEVSYNDLLTNQPFKTHSSSFGKIKSLQLVEGQYFCKLELPPTEDRSKTRNLVLVAHGPTRLSFECIDEEIAKVEWLYLLKDKLLLEEFRPVGDELSVREERFSNYYLILLKDNCQRREGSNPKHSMTYSSEGVAQLIQGYKDGSTRLLFECIDQQTSYLIFKMEEGSSFESMSVQYFCN